MVALSLHGNAVQILTTGSGIETLIRVAIGWPKEQVKRP
jgi:hypothetical protein